MRISIWLYCSVGNKYISNSEQPIKSVSHSDFIHVYEPNDAAHNTKLQLAVTHHAEGLLVKLLRFLRDWNILSSSSYMDGRVCLFALVPSFSFYLWSLVSKINMYTIQGTSSYTGLSFYFYRIK